MELTQILYLNGLIVGTVVLMVVVVRLGSETRDVSARALREFPQVIRSVSRWSATAVSSFRLALRFMLFQLLK